MVHRFYRIARTLSVVFAVSSRGRATGYQLTGSALPSSYPAAD